MYAAIIICFVVAMLFKMNKQKQTVTAKNVEPALVNRTGSKSYRPVSGADH